MSDVEGGALELQVHEASPSDAGRGIVRLPELARSRLGVLSGDAVVVEGDAETVVKVWPAGGSCADRECQIDSETRSNAGTRVGETVTLRPERVPDAEHVRLRVPASSAGAEFQTTVQRGLLERPVAPGEQVRIEAVGESGTLTVEATRPSGAVVITEQTTLELTEREEPTELRAETAYEDIGGLGDELAAVRELVELPLTDPELFAELGVDPPKGVLLHGPPGTGKTLIARAVAGEADATFISVSGPEILRKFKGESEQRLREIFEEASENTPAIIFFDEVDSLAPARGDEGGMESRVVAQLLSLLDGLETRGEVVVIGATNRIDAIDPALRRPGRFDREIEVGVPDSEGRKEILQIHTRRMALADDVDISRIASQTHGFVGADIQALTSEAAMAALGRVRTQNAALTVTQRDFEAALSSVEPTAMREVIAELPETSFADVGGLEDVKRALREAVEWPLAHPELYEETGTEPPTGVLLYGPPGTGKSMLARAIANESGVNLIRVAGPEILDRYVGESERAVRDVFDRARQAAPAIVFFDELDAIASQRGPGTHEATERVVSQLLTELDAAATNPNLVVLGATNRRDAIDPALLRPGRFESQHEVGVPTREGREQILAVQTRGKPLGEAVDLKAVAARLSGMTGAELASLVREASMSAIRDATARHGVEEATEQAAEITIKEEHFEAATEALESPGDGSENGQDARN